MTHPLDNEDISVVVMLVHLPTGAVAHADQTAPGDTEPTVKEVITKAGEEAMDELLKQIEEQGGG